MKIGFIGAGNMACAIIGGILGKNYCGREDIIASCRTEETRKRVEDEYGIEVVMDNRKVSAVADVLFLAVKPVFAESVIKEIRGDLKPGCTIVSIMAGKSLEWLKDAFSYDVKIVRTMPNTPALVQEAMTAVCPGASVTEEDLQKVMDIFSCFGKASIVKENLMDAVTAVSGSSPAYVFMFIEAMADQAVCEGMSRKEAYIFAAQSVLGSAKMVLETGKHPGELKDMVCSPAGTTIEAVKVLEEKGFRGIVMDAEHACAEKSAGM